MHNARLYRKPFFVSRYALIDIQVLSRKTRVASKTPAYSKDPETKRYLMHVLRTKNGVMSSFIVSRLHPEDGEAVSSPPQCIIDIHVVNLPEHH